MCFVAYRPEEPAANRMYGYRHPSECKTIQEHMDIWAQIWVAPCPLKTGGSDEKPVAG